MKEEVARIVADPEKVLNNKDLENVSGGISADAITIQKASKKINLIGNALAGATAVAGIGSLVASKIVKNPKAKIILKNIGAASLVSSGSILLGEKIGHDAGYAAGAGKTLQYFEEKMEE